jgi:hypothetical protein
MMRLRAAFPRFAVLAVLAFISLAPSRSNELFQDGRLQHTGLIVASRDECIPLLDLQRNFGLLAFLLGYGNHYRKGGFSSGRRVQNSNQKEDIW